LLNDGRQSSSRRKGLSKLLVVFESILALDGL
jgi:hypothetical protein